MKFAKELEQELVPEWRAKYLNYKLGKKKVKAIARAFRNCHQSPRTPGLRRISTFTPSPHNVVPSYSFLNRLGRTSTVDSAAPNLPHDAPRNIETGTGGEPEALTRYGSILGSPPKRSGSNHLPTLNLPDPAVDPERATVSSRWQATEPPSPPKSGLAPGPSAFEIGKTRSPGKPTLPAKYASIFTPKRVNSMPGVAATETPGGPRPGLRRLLSLGPDGGVPQPTPGKESDVPLEAYRELDVRQAEFFGFLDQELEKIEAFYKEKEDEATNRLEVLREQLHIMRDRRLDEIISKLQKSKAVPRKTPSNGFFDSNGSDDKANGSGASSQAWLKPLDDAIEAAKKLPEVVKGKPKPMSKNARAMQDLGTPCGPIPQDRRDYTRRPEPAGVPYRTAKRKLKTALQEYYRGLELLKAYALLNRTAFRKINKKYDKTVMARPTMRYMSEKVNKAWFVNSDVIDGHLHAVEDLYARYFYRGNHKIAVGKLRVKSAKAGDFNGSSFRNGLLLATGMVFGCEAISYASKYIFDDDSSIHTTTTFLMQIYGGYFLMLLLFLFFCLDCKVWTDQKINYGFVFEFDTRTQLDWRQLCEIPCLCVFLQGLIMWLNFSRYGGESMYIYWPVVLIGLTVFVIFLPAPVLYHRSRRWFAYSNWRLFFAGLYPVEFRDFFLGDMFCSQTYAMGNIELFFCLYANGWEDATSCNSSHSRLLGFFSTLPGIWRALQCLRRYYDTRNFFPHLVNCGKYTWTILYYMSLSLYRIHKTWHLRSFFIFCATVNAVYCTTWDLVMDWSLLNPYAKNRFLRDNLGYKNVYWYYAAIILDPILRFNWIFYAIYGDDVQHSAILSFMVALSEIFRRGMWTLFRVENEHCTNVVRYRASRDVPLPYSVPASTRVSLVEQGDESPLQRPKTPKAHAHGESGTTTGADLERQRTRGASIRRRSGSTPAPATRALTRVGTLLHAAHAQDFERRKKPEAGPSGGNDEDDEDDDEGSDEDAKRREEMNEEDVEDIARAEGLISRVSMESPQQTALGS
ncbi:SPX domain-containing protein [Lasiodiplodia theobromae]|uniref:Protein SYG1-like protein n=1 Tax=Lasiodiplodia theobromae TaxID=45133 RepID=A0A5N5DLD1_9PEZI|nr:SPX domain-containing protein [Lasiodiplodia theobromae]KAB2578141.1 Protein SYG1-like protein [Lasiodiplodia theobromae]KAF4534107.1 SPX domain-containing protein [Lasiodiplodia theobromae]